MLTYNELQQMLKSTTCHRVNLADQYIGVYNGLSNWGRVFVAVEGSEYHGVLEVASLTSEEYFTIQDFVEAGYALAE